MWKERDTSEIHSAFLPLVNLFKHHEYSATALFPAARQCVRWQGTARTVRTHVCALSGKGALHTASAFTSFLKHFSLRVSTKAAQNSGSAPHHRALCWNSPPGDPQSQHSLVKIQSTETCQHNSQGRKSRVEQAAGKVKK